jgi:hypothetical protein
MVVAMKSIVTMRSRTRLRFTAVMARPAPMVTFSLKADRPAGAGADSGRSLKTPRRGPGDRLPDQVRGVPGWASNSKAEWIDAGRASIGGGTMMNDVSGDGA